MKRSSLFWTLLGAAFLLVASQAALGPSLGSLLRRDLERQATEYDRLSVRVAPLGWIDLARGRLNGVDISAAGISFGGPRLADLNMKLKDIHFAVWPMLRGNPEITSLGPSSVSAKVAADDLNTYRQIAYPSVPAYFSIEKGRIGLAGTLTLLGSRVSFSTYGSLRVEDGSRLRYVPDTIELGGHRVPSSWLEEYGDNLALEIPLALPLPLVLRQVSLTDGALELQWSERDVDSTGQIS